VVELLNKEVDPASVWDGLFLRAGELLMQQPGIVALHSVTSVNALHYGFQQSASDETRRFLLLQAAAFLPMFHGVMLQRGGKLREELLIDKLEKEDSKAAGAAAVEEIFNHAGKDRLRAARQTLALLDGNKADAETLMTAARRLVFLKGNDAHDYKFSSAVLEDFYHATPAWRNRFLASSMFNLRGTGNRDNDLVKRARAALAT
jgi:hypothetical protein